MITLENTYGIITVELQCTAIDICNGLIQKGRTFKCEKVAEGWAIQIMSSTPEEVKEFIARAIFAYRSDDYRRALIDFKGYSSIEVQKQYADSNALAVEAIAWLSNQL